MNAIGLYIQYTKLSIRSQMQYRWSTFMSIAGMLIIIAMEFGAIWALFHRFGNLRGWTLAEVALLYGIVTVGFAIAEGVGRGFDLFANLIKSGDFDRLLLRPRRIALQVASQEIALHRAGRGAVGMTVLVWGWLALGIGFQPWRLGLLVFAILGGACLFYGLFVLQATLAFWTIDTLELFNTVTYGGSETGQYPLSIYRPWFRQFFTFVVPLAAVTYFPVLPILGRTDLAMHSPTWFCCVSPLIGVLFLLVSLWVWRFGVRHYCSTGS